MEDFVTADLHLGHHKVLAYSNRPFSCIEEHDQAIIDNWNAVVNRRDTVRIIGDFAWHSHNKYLSRLHGRKILILGSHDGRISDKALVNFTDVRAGGFIEKMGGREYWLAHCCHRTWERCFYGVPHLFGHCFDEQTEILTRRGFVRYDNIERTDQVLTVNMYNQQLEYQQPSDIHCYDYSGPMKEFRIRSGSILVTPDHDMLGVRPYSNDLYKIKAKDVQERMKIPLARCAPSHSFNESCAFFRVLGLIVSAGHFKQDEKGKLNAGGQRSSADNGVIIYQKTGTECYIRDTLNAAGVPFKEWQRVIAGTVMTHFYIKPEYVKQHIYPYLTEKRISDRLMNLRGSQFRHFLAGLIFGDGWIMNHRGYATAAEKGKYCQLIETNTLQAATVAYCTGDRVLCDQVQQLCTLNGIRTSAKLRKNGLGRGAWNVTFAVSKDERISYIGDVDYTGKTWCVTVPNGTVVARRDGFVFMTGNSHGRLVTFNLSTDIGVDCSHKFDMCGPYSPIPEWSVHEWVRQRTQEMDMDRRIETGSDGTQHYKQDDVRFVLNRGNIMMEPVMQDLFEELDSGD